MLCVKCGFSNSDLANCCVKCGAILPRMMQAFKAKEPEASPVITERLQLFENAVNYVRSGQWSSEQFVAFLDETSAKLNVCEEEIKALPLPEDQIEEFREELELGFVGLDLFYQGLEYFYAFVQEANEEYLTQGLELIGQGNEKINQALVVNRQCQSNLEELCSFSMGVI